MSSIELLVYKKYQSNVISDSYNSYVSITLSFSNEYISGRR
jgi:hypothetical protein